MLDEDETHDVTDLELHISVNGKDSISCKYRDFGSTILTLFGCRFLPNSRNNLLQSLGFRLLSYREKLVCFSFFFVLLNIFYLFVCR